MREAMQVRFEIDRTAGTITTTRDSLFSREKRSYPAEDIVDVKLAKKGIAVEEGYAAVCYAVVMKGRGESIELLCTEDEREAVSCYRELSGFLEYCRSNPDQPRARRKNQNSGGSD